MKLGIDRLVEDATLRQPLQGKRIGLVAHPASVTRALQHTLEALVTATDLKLTCVLGPQHGWRGEPQDNMVETRDAWDPRYSIPIYSLYGDVRRPTQEMLDVFDVAVIDLQDVGCRIYTYITTLLYMLEACSGTDKAVWVLDRPNPAGRPVEGMRLEPGWQSFVGAASLPMRYGLTIGELAQWFAHHYRLDVDLHVITMDGYDPHQGPGYGWPLGELSWVNPSPNAGSLSMARAFSGTVLIEGTTLSEGRGTTRALEVVGAPDLDIPAILASMHRLKADWLRGCHMRACYFAPTFHKHAGQSCHGFQFHVDHQVYHPEAFKPYRAVALLFKAIRQWSQDYELWRDFLYEYETDRLAIDVINGGPRLRTWVDNPQAEVGDLEAILVREERQWLDERSAFELYP